MTGVTEYSVLDIYDYVDKVCAHYAHCPHLPFCDMLPSHCILSTFRYAAAS
jgi:hypothetical protein